MTRYLRKVTLACMAQMVFVLSIKMVKLASLNESVIKVVLVDISRFKNRS